MKLTFNGKQYPLLSPGATRDWSDLTHAARRVAVIGQGCVINSGPNLAKVLLVCVCSVVSVGLSAHHRCMFTFCHNPEPSFYTSSRVCVCVFSDFCDRFHIFYDGAPSEGWPQLPVQKSVMVCKHSGSLIDV